MSTLFENQKNAVRKSLRSDDCFDIIERNIAIGGRDAVIFYLNGLVNNDIMEKMLEFFYRFTDEGMLKNAADFSKRSVPYVEVSILKNVPDITKNVLSGLPCLLVDWTENEKARSKTAASSPAFISDPAANAPALHPDSCAKASALVSDSCAKSLAKESEIHTSLSLSEVSLFSLEALSFDMRSYPQRDSGEAEDDKVLRGSKDGFVETVIFNLALMRRRIRDPNFITKAINIGNVTKSDVILCYLETKVDHQLLSSIEEKLSKMDIDALTMNQQTLIEALVGRKWLNPFPKVKYTERPDVAAAVCMKGNIIILVDNSPSALLIPTSIFDVLDEADDYYFPPLTGSYIRLSRYIISISSVILTPLWLLFLQYPELVPEWLSFVIIPKPAGIPVFWQLIIMEICIDGLRLAALHTPNSLTSALGIIGGIAFSQFAIDAGWFTTEATLYMAFVTIANYSLPNFELGYSLKFIRLGLLVTTSLFGMIGFFGGIVLIFVLLLTNRTISGKSFLYPLFPFDLKGLKNAFFRFRK